MQWRYVAFVHHLNGIIHLAAELYTQHCALEENLHMFQPFMSVHQRFVSDNVCSHAFFGLFVLAFVKAFSICVGHLK